MTIPGTENKLSLQQPVLQGFLSARIHILVYLLLSVLFCSCFFNWNNLGSHSIQGMDPSLNAWVLQRVTHQLMTDPLHPLDGNVYYPVKNSLTAWDHMTSLAVFNIPFQLISKNPWFGYNLLIFLAYFISALGGYKLAFTLTGNRFCAFWAGLFWGFLFFRVHHISHLQILSFQWMPFCVEALISYLRTEKNRHLFRLVIFTLLQSLVGWYLAVINGFLLLTVFVFTVGKKNVNKSFFIKGMIAGSIVLIIMLPFILAYSEQAATDKGGMIFSRNAKTSEQILPWDYLHPPAATIPGQLFKNYRYSLWGENALYTGFIPLLLIFPGLWLCFRGKKVFASIAPRRLALLSCGLILVGGVFSLGHNSLTLGIPLPWHYVCRVLPYLGFIRATPRFSLLVYMGILILSAAGLYFMLGKTSSQKKKLLFTTVLSALFILEVYPWKLPLNPDRTFHYDEVDIKISEISKEAGRELIIVHLIPTIYSEERENPGKAGVAQVNFFSNDVVKIRQRLVPRLMLGSTLHWSRMLNGISYLRSPTKHYMSIANMFPDERALRLIRLYDIDLVIMSEIPQRITPEQLERMLEAAKNLGEIIEIPGGKYILRLNKKVSS
ncbi:MAG: hypothetical protein ABIJ42_06395 [Acidobacteriota bacterium]